MNDYVVSGRSLGFTGQLHFFIHRSKLSQAPTHHTRACLTWKALYYTLTSHNSREIKCFPPALAVDLLPIGKLDFPARLRRFPWMSGTISSWVDHL